MQIFIIKLTTVCHKLPNPNHVLLVLLQFLSQPQIDAALDHMQLLKFTPLSFTLMTHHLTTNLSTSKR